MMNGREFYRRKIDALYSIIHNHLSMDNKVENKIGLAQIVRHVVPFYYGIKRAEFFMRFDTEGKFLEEFRSKGAELDEEQQLELDAFNQRYELATRLYEHIDMLATDEGRVHAIKQAAKLGLFPTELSMYVHIHYPSMHTFQLESTRKRAKHALRRGDIGVAVNLYEQLGMFFTAAVQADFKGDYLKAQSYIGLHELLKEEQRTFWKNPAFARKNTRHHVHQ